MRRFAVAALATAVLSAAQGCDRAPMGDARPSAQRVAEGPETKALDASERAVVRLDAATPEAPQSAALPEEERCALEWRNVEADEALPGAPEFEARRVEILGRARAEPVVFERAPGARESLSPDAARLRKVLADAPSAWEGLGRVLAATRRNLPLRREVLLREGYLYAETPALASVLSGSLRLDQLFGEREIVIERGERTRRLARKGSGYFDAPSAEGGAESESKAPEEASLLLLDRVGLPEAAPAEPLHFSLREVASSLGVSAIAVERITRRAVLVSLDYAGVRVRAVLDRRGASVSLRCEQVPEAARAQVEVARTFARRRQAAFQPLRGAIDRMVEEQLPFDEPKTEEGQQDGKLRPAWREAYFKGERRYEFNGDEYAVFDAHGRPRVPQVCIDFVTDVFERASGAWWAPRGGRRTRDPGRISFRKLGIENSRSVESLVSFAWSTPEWFDVAFIASDERVPFRRRKEFFAQIAERPHRYQPGDVVFIHGLREDDDKPHYHSFFVYDSDPVSGAPILLAANAGRPRVRSWEGEMQNAPKRSIVARLRPRLEFLEALFAADRPLEAPARLSSGAVEPNPGSR